MDLTPQQSAQLAQDRLACRSSLKAWSRYVGYEPAAHHLLIIRELERAAREPDVKVIINVPRGVGKSTFGSRIFPPWYISQPLPPWLSDRTPGDSSGRSILACSHSAHLVTGFGRWCRNKIKMKGRVLGYQLRSDTQAADEWETTNGGLYFAAGVGAGIAGHRADLGLIDDFLGSEEDADSEVIRDRQWEWYMGDFLPCLRPGASQVILATPRHEDDLQGRIKKTEGHLWRIIKIPWIAKEADPLGRTPGQRIWPEYVTDEMDRAARKSARIFSAQYQQEPTPEDGDVFQEKWLTSYTPKQLPKNLRIYIGSDHAISKKEEANNSVFLPHGLCDDGFLWLLPDAIYGHLSSKEQVDAIFKLARLMKERYGNVHWTAEKCHISDALGPYITDKMKEDRFFFNIEEVHPAKDKRTRASSIAALAQAGMVRYPTFATWWPQMRRELLGFDNLGEDDFVDAHAHVGRKVDELIVPRRPKEKPLDDLTDLINRPFHFSVKNLRLQGAFEHKLVTVDDN